MPTPSRRRRPIERAAADDDAERIRRARREEFKRRIGWPIAAVGVGLFLLGQIGGRTGLVSLPFDRHHILSQVGGFLLAIRGLTWSWR